MISLLPYLFNQLRENYKDETGIVLGCQTGFMKKRFYEEVNTNPQLCVHNSSIKLTSLGTAVAITDPIYNVGRH